MAAKKKTLTVQTTVYGVSLRDQPEGKINGIILPNGAKIVPLSEKDGWTEIAEGWLRDKYVK